MRGQGYTHKIVSVSLNPCSVGICSVRDEIWDIVDAFFVLILVLLEYAL